MRETASRTTRRTSPEGLRLGERLRQLRVAAGLTQSELAGDRFSKEYVSQIERGKTRPTADTIEWLAERLGVDAGFLASGVATDERARLEGALSRAEALYEAEEDAEAAEAFEPLVGAARATGMPELQVRALCGSGLAKMRTGEHRAAVEILNEARSITEAESFSDVERADVLFWLGCCRYQLTSVQTALALFNEALGLAERSGLPCDALKANILTWRSRCYRRQRDFEAARDDVERALELAEAMQDTKALGEAYFQASLIAERDGHWVLARTYAEKAKAQYEELTDRTNIGRLLNNLGGIEFLLGKPEQAITRLQEAFGVVLEHGNDDDIATVVSSLAQVHLKTGDPVKAEEHARHALTRLGTRENKLDEIGNARLVLGRALLDQDRLDEAEVALAEAEDALAQLSSASHRAAAWVAQGDLAQRRGEDRVAAAHYRRAAEALQDFRF